nr:MAG TPA: hypothetical protein [Crassvirales sp.]
MHEILSFHVSIIIIKIFFVLSIQIINVCFSCVIVSSEIIFYNFIILL